MNKVIIADFDGICSTDILVLRLKNKNHDIHFYHSYLLSDNFNKIVLYNVSGASLPRTNYKSMSVIEIPIPTENQQKIWGKKLVQEKSAILSILNLMNSYLHKSKLTLNKLY